MTEPHATRRAAELLAALHRDGRQVAALPPELRPDTLDQGYDIQDRLIALLGDAVAGWKLGVGSARARAQTGIGRSIAGRVLAPRCVRAGETVAVRGPAPVTVEFEIAYVLARDIRPDAPPATMDAVAETRVTFELVRARYEDRRGVGWPSFAADNAGFEALVVGPAVDPSGLAELAASVVVLLDGRERARALTGDDATDPRTAFHGFLALARERGMTLPAGAIVSTGTVTAPFDVAGPAEIEARFLGLGTGFRIQAA